MMSEPETARRPVWPWIVAAVIGVPVLYVASIPVIVRTRPRPCDVPPTVAPIVNGYMKPVIYLAHLPETRPAIMSYINILPKR